MTTAVVEFSNAVSVIFRLLFLVDELKKSVKNDLDEPQAWPIFEAMDVLETKLQEEMSVQSYAVMQVLAPYNRLLLSYRANMESWTRCLKSHRYNGRKDECDRWQGRAVSMVFGKTSNRNIPLRELQQRKSWILQEYDRLELSRTELCGVVIEAVQRLEATTRDAAHAYVSASKRAVVVQLAVARQTMHDLECRFFALERVESGASLTELESELLMLNKSTAGQIASAPSTLWPRLSLSSDRHIRTIHSLFSYNKDAYSSACLQDVGSQLTIAFENHPPVPSFDDFGGVEQS